MASKFWEGWFPRLILMEIAYKNVNESQDYLYGKINKRITFPAIRNQWKRVSKMTLPFILTE